VHTVVPFGRMTSSRATNVGEASVPAIRTLKTWVLEVVVNV
jgi:hypothetical protein